MPWAAIGAIGAAVIGGAMSQSGGSSGTINATADKQAEVTKYMFDIANQQQEPYRNVGVNALYELSGYTKRPITPATATPASYDPVAVQSLNDITTQLNQLRNSYQSLYNSLPRDERVGNPSLISMDAQIKTLKNQQQAAVKNVQPSTGGVAGTTGPEPEYEYVKTGEGVDVTGGSKKFMDLLENLDFKLDETDPIYQWQKAKTEEAVNAAMAARGGYDSRVAINALADANMQLQSNEINRQYNQNYLRRYGQLIDLYNMASQQGQSKYNSLLDLVKIGQGAASSTGQNAIYTGSALSNIYGAAGAGQVALQQQQNAINARTWEGITNAIPGLINYYSNQQTPSSNNAIYNWGYSPATWASVDQY